MIRLKSILFSVWFYAASAALTLFGHVLAWLAPASLPAYAKVWSRTVLAGLPICGITYEILGREYLPAQGAVLIASMHQSAFDTLIWFRLVPRCRYVVKIELMRIPLFGRLVRLSGQIAVDRAGGAATLRGLLRDGSAELAQGHQLVIFPEGTRAATGEMAPLQPGIAALARAAGSAVLPVVTDSGFCWGRGARAKRPGIIRVKIMPPIEAGLPREAMMTRLKDAFVQGSADLAILRGAVDNSVHTP